MTTRPRKPTSTQGRARRRPSVVDVARAAGVSPMTVSNVVNARHKLMSKATRLKVEEAIEHLGYRPQTTGRNLRLARGFSIGMIIVDESPTFLADPFITQLVAGLSNYLSERDYALVLQAVNEKDFADSSLIRRAETDAVCTLLSGSPGRRRRLLQRLAAIDHPLILFQEALPAGISDAASIRQDDFGGGKALAELVLERGARRLLFLAPALTWPAVQERERGIRAAITGFGRGASVSVIPCGNGSVAAVIETLDGYTGRRKAPDAVMGANDQIGIAAMKWLRREGLRMPQDVLVTGFNAFEFWNYAEPILTTMRSPAYELGARGGEAMLHRLREGEFARRDEVFPVELQIGGST